MGEGIRNPRAPFLEDPPIGSESPRSTTALHGRAFQPEAAADAYQHKFMARQGGRGRYSRWTFMRPWAEGTLCQDPLTNYETFYCQASIKPGVAVADLPNIDVGRFECIEDGGEV